MVTHQFTANYWLYNHVSSSPATPAVSGPLESRAADSSAQRRSTSLLKQKIKEGWYLSHAPTSHSPAGSHTHACAKDTDRIQAPQPHF